MYCWCRSSPIPWRGAWRCCGCIRCRRRSWPANRPLLDRLFAGEFRDPADRAAGPGACRPHHRRRLSPRAGPFRGTAAGRIGIATTRTPSSSATSGTWRASMHWMCCPGCWRSLPREPARLFNLADLASPFGLSRPTIRDYVTLLERVFLLERLPPWHSNPPEPAGEDAQAALRRHGSRPAPCSAPPPPPSRPTGRCWDHFSRPSCFRSCGDRAAGHDVPHTFFHYRDKDRVECRRNHRTRPARARGGGEVRAGATGDRRGLSRPSQAEEHRWEAFRWGGVVALRRRDLRQLRGRVSTPCPCARYGEPRRGEEPRMPRRGGSVAASNTRPATLQPKPRTSNGVRGRGGRRGETTGRRRPSSPIGYEPGPRHA